VSFHIDRLAKDRLAGAGKVIFGEKVMAF